MLIKSRSDFMTFFNAIFLPVIVILKDLFISKSLNLISKHKSLDNYNQVKIKYGLEVMYNFIMKTSVILLIAAIFNSFIEVLLIFAFYGLLRTFIHGAHGKSNLLCWILTLISYSTGIYIIKNYTIPYFIEIIICFIALLSMVLFAPSDTKYRPLINRNKRIKFKIISIILTVIYSLVILFTNFKYTGCLTISLTLSTIIINPLTYLLLGLKRNNYKSYK